MKPKLASDVSLFREGEGERREKRGDWKENDEEEEEENNQQDEKEDNDERTDNVNRKSGNRDMIGLEFGG